MALRSYELSLSQPIFFCVINQLFPSPISYSASLLSGGDDKCLKSCSFQGDCKNEKCICDIDQFGQSCSVKIMPLSQKPTPQYQIKKGQFFFFSILKEYQNDKFNIVFGSSTSGSFLFFFLFDDEFGIPSESNHDWKLEIKTDSNKPIIDPINIKQMVNTQYINRGSLGLGQSALKIAVKKTSEDETPSYLQISLYQNSSDNPYFMILIVVSTFIIISVILVLLCIFNIVTLLFYSKKRKVKNKNKIVAIVPKKTLKGLQLTINEYKDYFPLVDHKIKALCPICQEFLDLQGYAVRKCTLSQTMFHDRCGFNWFKLEQKCPLTSMDLSKNELEVEYKMIKQETNQRLEKYDKSRNSKSYRSSKSNRSGSRSPVSMKSSKASFKSHFSQLRQSFKNKRIVFIKKQGSMSSRNSSADSKSGKLKSCLKSNSKINTNSKFVAMNSNDNRDIQSTKSMKYSISSKQTLKKGSIIDQNNQSLTTHNLLKVNRRQKSDKQKKLTYITAPTYDSNSDSDVKLSVVKRITPSNNKAKKKIPRIFNRQNTNQKRKIKDISRFSPKKKLKNTNQIGKTGSPYFFGQKIEINRTPDYNPSSNRKLLNSDKKRRLRQISLFKNEILDDSSNGSSDDDNSSY